jgi:hypothetical protein
MSRNDLLAGQDKGSFFELRLGEEIGQAIETISWSGLPDGKSSYQKYTNLGIFGKALQWKLLAYYMTVCIFLIHFVYFCH